MLKKLLKKSLMGIVLSIVLSTFLFVFLATETFAQVVINEFMPNPTDESQEWVEFYNSGASTEDLSLYFFDDDTEFDGESGSTKVSLSGSLQSLSSCYLSLSSYLNNSGDFPTLFGFDGSTKDTYSYTSTVEDKSFARVPDGGDWQTEQVPTRSSTLCSSLAPSPSPTPTASPTPAPTASPTPTATSTKTPTPTPTKTPTPKPTKTPSPSPTSTEEPNGSPIPTLTPTPGATVLGESAEKKGSVLPYLLIIGGIVCLGFAGYSLYNGRSEEV